ncbi:hypothetical protein [Halopseudomonas sp.]|jgi:hypothetical protein|uniref:hypothetical protein n=1 Tax=Halopseudomonas sp. TaxID=2901191 RepID=UPI003001C0B5|nr:hypothetical protein [Halopseudomonas aestusnigri]
MQSPFSGPFFSYVMSQPPLQNAEHILSGSSAMLFQKNGKLYRLTTDGCGHNFLSLESSLGSSSVVQVIEYFGRIAPSDEYSDAEHYWLAESEWLLPVNPESNQGKVLQPIIAAISDEDLAEPEERAPDTLRRQTRHSSNIRTENTPAATQPVVLRH